MHQYTIAPSILSADFTRLGEEVENVINAGADWIHFDVMDNHYVPNLSFGPIICQALISRGITVPIDVHLMVEPVDKMIEAFIKAGASNISFHPEASTHIDRSLQLIREGGCQAGLVFNPATGLEIIEYVIDKLDFILLMSVNPGFGGQKFIPSTLKKIHTVSQLIKKSGLNIKLGVDGGINTHNIGGIARAGADTFIAGSAIFGREDYANVIKEMRSEIQKNMYGSYDYK